MKININHISEDISRILRANTDINHISGYIRNTPDKYEYEPYLPPLGGQTINRKTSEI